ncbi:protein-L-isoaspartate O-methyltransferase family protein [Chitinilyticum aquatile]|uniref:protein-L-isoaspartate O-methyltransferase family protein n=1 Tax=Chitinilyticum aquatile TaxID=362520 RepID=UPI000423D2A6|nr:protein-L-isoaspartate O-methyltransferase [Chitinilyticum aquatile]
MDWERARYLMVEQQIRPWNVTDQKVLQRFLDVKREDFVPADKRELALADIELPVGDGARMLAPKIEARFLQEAAIKPTDRVLVVGATTGYLVALAAGLGQEVYGIEQNASLVQFANAALTKAGVKNAQVQQGSAADGQAGLAPFDVILVSGSVADVPAPLLTQLGASGRLILVTGAEPSMSACRVTKSPDGVSSTQKLFEYNLPALLPETVAFAF